MSNNSTAEIESQVLNEEKSISQPIQDIRIASLDSDSKDRSTNSSINDSSNLKQKNSCDCFLIMFDPPFEFGKESARKGGVKADLLPEGWVYEKKEDAEAVATRFSNGKRKATVIPWPSDLIKDLWHGTKKEASLARKKISLQITLNKNNEKLRKIEFDCGTSGLHTSWLYRESLPDDMSDKEKLAFKHYKPSWIIARDEKDDLELQQKDINLIEEDVRESLGNKVKNGLEVIVGGVHKKITDMANLDSRFAQLEAPGQPCVIINREDAQPISPSDFNRRLSGEVVFIGSDSNDQPKYMPASSFWTGNSRKCIYKKIVFNNKSMDNSTYNLFTGFGVKPKKGKCDKIFSHIKDVICAGNEENNLALLKLLAWQIQNIGIPSRIIVALKSKIQQVGKGCLLADILAVIYGNSGFVTSDLGQIITRFNDTIRGKAFIFLDEALFSGDRKSADAVKSLATTTRMGVESKGIPTVQFPIAVNLFLATNHDDAAHVEEADARYWILEVSPHRSGDTEYFKELYSEIKSGGLEAFMHYLLTLDVSSFIPSRDVPKDNESKDAMIRNSINPYDARKWLEACCNDRMILGLKPINKESSFPWETWEAGAEYENGLLSTAYTEWQKGIRSPVAPKPTAANKFGELLNKSGFVPRVQGQRYRKLPDPDICLETVIGMIEKLGK